MASDDPRSDPQYLARIAALKERGIGSVPRNASVRKAKENRLKRRATHANDGQDEKWTIRVRPDLRDQIKALSEAEEGTSISDLMDEAMELLLASRRAENGEDVL